MNLVDRQHVINKKAIRFKKEYWTFIILFFITAMAQASEGYNIGLLNYLAIGIILIYCLIADEKTILYVIMYLMPANRLFELGGFSVNLLVLLIFFSKDIIFGSKKLNHKFLFLSLLFSIYTIMYVWQYHSYQEILQSIKTFTVLFFCIKIFGAGKHDIRELYKYSVIFLALGLVSNFFVAIIVNPAILGFRRLAISGDSNPNALAIVVSYALAQLVVSLNSKHIRNPRGIVLLFTILCLIGLYTQSRTFIVNFVLILLWVLFPWFKAQSSSTLKRIIFVIFIFIGLFVLLKSSYQISDQIKVVLDRFISPSRNDITNGRIEIWSQYIAAFKDNPNVFLFGVGMDYTRLGIYMMAHNMWIEQISSFGIVGTLLVIMLYASAAKAMVKKHASKNKYAGAFNLLPIVVVFASGMFSHSFMALNVTIQLFLGIVTLQLKPCEINNIKR